MTDSQKESKLTQSLRRAKGQQTTEDEAPEAELKTAKKPVKSPARKPATRKPRTTSKATSPKSKPANPKPDTAPPAETSFVNSKRVWPD